MAEKITNNMIKDIEQRTSFWLGQLGENCEASTFDDEFRQKFLKLLSDKYVYMPQTIDFNLNYFLKRLVFI